MHKQVSFHRRACCISTAEARFASGNIIPKLHRHLLSSLCLVPGFLFTATAQAEFTLNFSGATGAASINAIGPNVAGTESLIDPSNGIRYWHYVVDDPATGFAQDVYIRSTGASSCAQSTICSASGGTTALGTSVNVLGANSAINSGNGTGNPNHVLIREVLGGTWDATSSTWTCDTGYCDEFIKDSYTNKPKITQGINDADFSSKFIIDMSGVALSDNSTPLTITDNSTGATGASLTNVQTVFDASTSSSAVFDLANDGQQVNVSGGQYTYTTGTGVLGANGTYVYVDGGFDPKALDYTPFRDPSQNFPF